MAKRLRVFVGSSVEKLDIAYSIQENLEHDVEATVWTQGFFRPSATTIASLTQQLDDFDAAIFVFGPDDVAMMRGTAFDAVRDNVVFELGLFIGALGLDRCFFVVPRGEAKLHIPTDLLGVTPVTYDSARSDNNLLAALGPACSKIRAVLKALPARSMADSASVMVDAVEDFAILARRLDAECIDRELYNVSAYIEARCPRRSLLQLLTVFRNDFVDGLWADNGFDTTKPFLYHTCGPPLLLEGLVRRDRTNAGTPAYSLTSKGLDFMRWLHARKLAEQSST